MGLLLFFSVAKKGAEEVDKRTCPEACLYLEQTVGALEDIYCNFGLQPCPPPPMLPECSDGLDNDGDAFVDYPADPDCTSPWDDDEEGFFPVPLPWP